jgi:AraC family transcriptional regulator of adaptative response/methylated-DNA-[protein]-cysteine methyltransferase
MSSSKLRVTYRDDAARWAAVCSRSKDADGAFYYSVRTTGVYCRPSCPSRGAKRGNVAFHVTTADAEAHGFRPCLRCHPLAIIGKDPATERITEIARYITAHADSPLTLATLSTRAGLSPFHFQRTFKAVMGVTPKQFHQDARLVRLKQHLRAGDDVLGATFEAGFGSTARVYVEVDGRLGMTPVAYRQGGAGERIYYAVQETPLGLLMMAATDRGVCFVQFGDNADALNGELQREYPKAAIEPSAATGAPALDRWMEALGAHLALQGPRPDLPLDLRGTAFQIRVWRFLMSIKDGDVLSYAELAVGIGAPKAVRAVAAACAANRIAVLVPCHRVLRSNGGLGGYRWGEARKRVLLDGERRARSQTPERDAG